MIHNRRHQSPESQALVLKTELAYAALEVEFQHERDAELAAVRRGVRPVPGQWKLDQVRLSDVQGLPVVKTEPQTDVPRAAAPLSNPQRLLKSVEWLWHDEPSLKVYPDLWHEKAAS